MMMMSSSGGKLERKTIEKNRRIMMKSLCFKLVSLVPPHHFNPPKELLSQQDQIEQAAGYIKKLGARVEKLRRRKAEALRITDRKTVIRPSDSKLPVVKLKDLGNSTLEVVVITEFLTKNITLPRLVRVIEEEGAEVVTASLSHIADKIFHTLHARAKLARVGVDILGIYGRLQELMIC